MDKEKLLTNWDKYMAGKKGDGLFQTFLEAYERRL